MEMSDLQENLTQLMEITGLDRTSAENILKINNYNLERAINCHLENDVEYASAGCSASSNSNIGRSNNICGNNSNNTINHQHQQQSRVASIGLGSVSALPPPPSPIVDPSSAVSESATLPDDDHDHNIRAPIPPKREQLLMPEEDNFRYRKRRAPVFTVCPLRNFAHEAEMQEQQLSWYMENREMTSTTQTTGTRNSRHRPKRSRLDDLFCPPIDLLFWGSFQAAREHATSRNRWLIVNLQDNSEFKSQILNRDIWPDPDLKELILKYFVLWQVSVDNAEGLRFKAFYHVEKMPYVCIIDPRTGEEKLSCDVVTPQVFRTDLLEFLDANLFSLEPKEQNLLNPYLSGRSTSTQKSSTITRASSSVAALSSSSSSSSSTLSSLSSSSILSATQQPPITSSSAATFSSYKKCDYHQMSELSEEDQLELAIKNSLKETQDLTASIITTTTTPGAGMSQQSSTSNDNSFCGIVLNDNTSDNELQEISDSENETNSVETYEKYLGDKNDSQTKIILRLSAGQRVQLEWTKTTKLRAIRLYIDSKYPDIAKEPYKLISSFPRQNILELDDKLTLEEAKLHPTAVLHLHPDD